MFPYDLFGRLLSETTAQGVVLRDYLWRGRVPVAQIDRGDSGWIRSPDGKLSLLGGHGPDRVLYLHTDYEGTPRVATDAAGHVVWRWNGNAFGTSRPTGGRIQPADNDAHSDHPGSRPIAVINLRYPGQYYDRETGFFYNRARYYDPGTGRYVSSDPIGLRGGINTYAYVGGNPVGYVDPLGLWTLQIGGTVNINAFGFVYQYSGGFAIDGSGDVGTYTAQGPGVGSGDTASIGTTVLASPNAPDIGALNGPFVNALWWWVRPEWFNRLLPRSVFSYMGCRIHNWCGRWRRGICHANGDGCDSHPMYKLTLHGEMKFFLRLLLASIIVILVVASEQRFSLLEEYREAMPTKPDAISGKVVAVNVHDTVVYVTRRDADYLDSMRDIQDVGFPILVITVLLLGRLRKGDKRR